MHLTFFITAICTLIAFTTGQSYASQSIAEDDKAAVILAYHRINEDNNPQTNLGLEQFKQHLKAIANQDMNVIPLPALVKALRTDTPLPSRTIAITFEGGYASAFEHAIPLLLDAGLPFTIFFSSDKAASNTNEYMSWRDIKSLKANKQVNFGIHPASYSRLYTAPTTETLAQINRARIAFRKNLGQEATLFSYPFGEYSRPYHTLIKEQKFQAAFALHSGAVSPSSDTFALPRFAMTESYGNLERFTAITQALPLPVTDIEPDDPHLKTPASRFGFTAPKGLAKGLNALSCFVAGQAPPTIQIIDRRVEITTAEPVEDNRTRLNCTLPGPKNENDNIQWRWFSRILITD